MADENNKPAAVKETGNNEKQSTRDGRRRSRHHRVSRYKKRAYLLSTLLGLAIILLIGVTIGLGAKIASLSDTKSLLSQRLVDVEAELEQSRTRLADVEQDLQVLVEGRFPNLLPLVPDKVLEIGKHYVRNIVFTVIGNDNGKGRNRVYEYKLVMENTYDYPVYPDVRLLVFDKLGIQAGVDDIEEKLELGPGESRSYSSTVDVFMNSVPSYFIVDFKAG